MSLNASAARTLREIKQIPGNEVCADCGASGESEFLPRFYAGGTRHSLPAAFKHFSRGGPRATLSAETKANFGLAFYWLRKQKSREHMKVNSATR